MKAKIFLLVAVVLIPLATAYAQKVVVDGTQVIIDASTIPNTKDKKARSTTSGFGSIAPNNYTDIASLKSDEKVYYKFEVSKKNNSDPFFTTLDAKSWNAAIEHCANTNIDGTTGWRLPTRRELVLMWVLKAELEQVPEFEAFREEYYYHSATEYFNQVHVTSFLDGYTIWSGLKEASANNDYAGHVRCIRDL